MSGDERGDETVRKYHEYQEKGRQQARRQVHDPSLPAVVRQAARDHLARNRED